MSVTQDDFLSWLRNQITSLPLPEKDHTIQRIYEKLRLIHNAVGAVHRQEKTILQFKAEYPNVYEKIKTELQPFIQGSYLTIEGWRYFEKNMFDPRHDAIVSVMVEIRGILRGSQATTELEAF